MNQEHNNTWYSIDSKNRLLKTSSSSNFQLQNNTETIDTSKEVITQVDEFIDNAKIYTSISDITSENGHLIISFANGLTFDCGKVRGDKFIPIKTNAGIEYRYESESEDQLRLLVPIEDIFFKFENLTDEQRDLLSFHFSDFTENEIKLLQEPALEAAQLANDATSEAIKATKTITQTNDKVKVAEETRGAAEDIRNSSEKIRISNENKRTKEEAIRVQSEKQRKIDEAARVSDEVVRVSQETLRIKAETERDKLESNRITSEDERKSNETIRCKNEKDRQSFETARIESELIRITKETERQGAETNRNNSENIRLSNEEERKLSESKRVSSESTRTSKEDIRINNESKRITAETARLEAENRRITAENQRVLENAKAIKDVNKATNSANTSAIAAQETADHPTYIGDDFYVYKWDKTTKAYNKTNVFVKGDAFSIKKVYSSIDLMEKDVNNKEIKEGDFVLINTNNTEDPDNAQLYIKTYNQESKIYGFDFLVDMSGAVGFTGKTPQFTVGKITTLAEGSKASLTLSEGGTDSYGNPIYLINLSIPRGDKGKAPVITIGTVTTVKPNVSASAQLILDGVTDTGEPKYKLNMSIPKGDAASLEVGDAQNLTVTFNNASIRENIATGEKMSILFGKIKKFFSDLKTIAFTGKFSDLIDKPTTVDGYGITNASKTGHKHTKSEITDFPTSMPASDVSAWAKASTKPTYTPTEVGAVSGWESSASTPAKSQWYRIATSPQGIFTCAGTFYINGKTSGNHSGLVLNAGISYGYNNSVTLTQTLHSSYITPSISKARIVYHNTYSGNYAYLEVFITKGDAATEMNIKFVGNGWLKVAPNTVGSIPSGYVSKEITFSTSNHSMVGNLIGTATTATALQTARTINGTSFNGSANITTANWGIARSIGIVSSDGTSTAVPISVNGSANVNLKLPSTIKASITGNASTATTLQTARTINGVSFNGSANITITAAASDVSAWAKAANKPTYTAAEVGASPNNHNHSGVYEPVFTKNTAFNKNFGTAAGTVCQGNDSRLSNSRPANGGTSAACTGNSATATKVVATAADNSTAELVRGTMGTNDYFRISIGGANDAGYAEIATADGGNEPIYLRQYSGNFTKITRTATLLDGSGNTQFPGSITSGVKDAYISWGGRDLAGSVSPVDAAMYEEFSANRLAFMKPAGITIEYSTNGGTSWTNYGSTDEQKVGLVTTSNTLTIGKTSTANVSNKLRVTINATNGGIYFLLRKIAIYVSTQGNGGSNVLVEYSNKGSESTFKTLKTSTLNGWGGWNIINTTTSFGGGSAQTGNWDAVRLTFGITSAGTSGSLIVTKLRMFGETMWSSVSNLSSTGHIYSYDTSQNVTFPAKVTASSFAGATATSSTNGLMSSTDKTKLDGIATNANNYSHPTTAGNKHIPAGGASGQILRWSGDGTAVWGADNNTTYSPFKVATASAAGGIGLVPAPAAGKHTSFLRGDGSWVIPTNTTYGLASTTANGLLRQLNGSTSSFMRGDGTWATPPNTTYGLATQSANGLMSANDKKRLDNAIVPTNVTVATTLTSLSIANYSIKVTLSAASALSFASTPPEGWECMIDIKNTGSSTITQPLPNASGWQCEDTSIAIAAGKIASISVRRVHSIYVVIAKGN